MNLACIHSNKGYISDIVVTFVKKLIKITPIEFKKSIGKLIAKN